MNDKNINPEGTKPEDTSGDDISESSAYESSAYNRRENLIPSEGIQDPRGNSSYEDSTSGGPGFGKMTNQETHFESPEINKTASENLKMNSNFPPQRKKRSSMSYICLLYTSPSPRDGLLSRMPSSA